MSLTPEQRAATDADFARFEALLVQVNALLRALAMGGCPVTVDLVERPDRLTGGEYTQIVYSPPQYPPPDEPL